jgi:hypothetical protein
MGRHENYSANVAADYAAGDDPEVLWLMSGSEEDHSISTRRGAIGGRIEASGSTSRLHGAKPKELGTSMTWIGSSVPGICVHESFVGLLAEDDRRALPASPRLRSGCRRLPVPVPHEQVSAEILEASIHMTTLRGDRGVGGVEAYGRGGAQGKAIDDPEASSPSRPLGGLGRGRRWHLLCRREPRLPLIDLSSVLRAHATDLLHDGIQQSLLRRWALGPSKPAAKAIDGIG